VTNKERWIIDRESELLPVPYYHIVFTIPHHFNKLLPVYNKEVYSALFIASWQTIQVFAADPKYLGAKTGMVAILHIPPCGTGYGVSSYGCTLIYTVSFLEEESLLPVNGSIVNTRESTYSQKGH